MLPIERDIVKVSFGVYKLQRRRYRSFKDIKGAKVTDKELTHLKANHNISFTFLFPVY